MVSKKQAVLLLAGIGVILSSGLGWWFSMSPAERWVTRFGADAKNDLMSLARGESPNLGWPLIDATIVANSGYVVVALHDEYQTELLFTSNPGAAAHFARTNLTQSIKAIRSNWYEVTVTDKR